MSVPTHNLYDFVYQALENRFILAYFYPYGSKHLENLQSYYHTHYPNETSVSNLHLVDSNFFIPKEKNVCYKIFPKSLVDDSLSLAFNPVLICHDQEPLDFTFCQNLHLHQNYIQKKSSILPKNLVSTIENFRWFYASSRQKYWIILHSELNSEQVKLYHNSGKFVCAYWWSHAIMALDWYRFAKHDQFLDPASNIKKLFLLYSREATGSRTYRNTLQHAINKEKITQCQIGSFDEEYTATSNSSAEYSWKDINQSAIQVVAETIFDKRIHLTEKTLRPLACGQPFILVAGPNSLQYLKSYGFKTFSPWINESYDSELNPDKRLNMVVQEMKRIEDLTDMEQKTLIENCLAISRENKKIFFSDAFFNQVKSELIDNIKNAQNQTNNELDWKFMWKFRQEKKKENLQRYKSNLKNYYEISLIRHLKQGGTIDDYVPPWKD